MKRCSVLLAFALLALPACGRGGPEGGTIPRERFVAASVALRTAKFPQPASAATRADSAKARADSARIRAAVLKKEGVTVKELQAFVEARRDETEELAEVWEEIAARVARADSIAKAKSPKRDSAAAPGTAPSPPATTSPAPPPPVPQEFEEPPRGMPGRPPPPRPERKLR